MNHPMTIRTQNCQVFETGHAFTCRNLKAMVNLTKTYADIRVTRRKIMFTRFAEQAALFRRLLFLLLNQVLISLCPQMPNEFSPAFRGGVRHIFISCAEIE